jgi:hypothetical protein
MSVTLNGTSGLTFNDATTQNTSAFYGGLGFRNRIINGAMMIDQRNAGASITPSVSGTYALDRWRCGLSAASKFSVQQSSIAPSGFTKSTLITSTSAYTVGALEQFQYSQNIEGYNIADLGWGTASAATVTLSFWVRSSLTGTFGLAIRNSDSTRIYCPTYTINAANTWEQKSVTIAGDTTGTWATDNTGGLILYFNLGMGSSYQGTANVWQTGTYYGPTGATNLVSTNGATFYITGVQLEKGSTATSFDYRPYGTELNLCQRYFVKFSAPVLRGSANNSTTNSARRMGMPLPVQMRATPTNTQSGLQVWDGSVAANVSSISNDYSTAQVLEMDFNTDTSGMTLGRVCIQYQIGSLSCSAEL